MGEAGRKSGREREKNERGGKEGVRERGRKEGKGGREEERKRKSVLDGMEGYFDVSLNGQYTLLRMFPFLQQY
jgi:hypothetical protein